MLQEQDRLKLDGIVKQMIDNKEPESNIQFVVNDFKSRYDKTPEQSGPGFISGVKEDFESRAQKTQQAVDSPTAAIGQKVVRVAGQAAGLATDVIGQGISSIGKGVSKLIPGFVKEPVKKIGTTILQSYAGKSVV